mmetsp:Transcript_16045/g.36692  ORF Transcript_16045/g.36692 Transcript_16045/m.36692 type:complete len:416 (+) Transcript_16045:447-1694(+)
MGDCAFRSATRENQCPWPVLGDQPCRVAGLRKHDNELGSHVQRRLHSGRTHSLRGVKHSRLVARRADRGKERIIIHDTFSFSADIVLGLDCLDREITVCGLTRQHHTIGAVQNSIRNITCLGPSRTRVLDHRLQHLSRSDHWLPLHVGLGYHHLLCEKHLLSRNLHAQITTCHHDTIRLGQNFVIVFQTFFVFNLGDDFDTSPPWSQNLADVPNILTRLHKRCGHKIDTLGNTECNQVALVLVAEDRQVHMNSRQIHVLALADNSTVHHLGHYVVRSALSNLQGQAPISHKDGVARLDTGWQLVVGASNASAVSLEIVVRNNFERLARFESNATTRSVKSRTNLGSFGIQQNGQRMVRSLLHCLPQPLNRRPMGLMISVREIQSSDVHPCVHKLHQIVDIPTLRSHRTNDLALGK